MNTTKILTALSHWAALDPDERHAFGRHCGELASLAGQVATDTVMPDAVSSHADILAPASSAARVAPLPLGSGQRTPRLPVVPHDPEIFASQSYRKIAQATRLMHVYIASCEGTARLYEASRTTVYKAGTHVGMSVDTRIATLNASAYASWYKSGLALTQEPGFQSWRAERLPLEAPRPRHSPVTPLGTSLAVALPAVIASEAFDIAVTKALHPVSISTLRLEARVQLSLVGMGFDADRLERYTARGDGTGHKLAVELVRMQPRRDAAALATLVEGIVAALVRDHL